MGRAKKAPWSLHKQTGTDNLRVHFTHAGKRHRESTGSSDPRTAEVEAARIYAEVVSGRKRRVAKKGPRSLKALDVLFAEWLASLEGSHDETTIENYMMYVRAHFLPYFGSLSGFTTAAIGDYTAARLRRVQAKTVRKEHSAMRVFIAWCVDRGHIDEQEAPTVRRLPQRATGTPNDARRKVGGWIDLQANEARAILSELPERGKGNRPVRAYYTAMWETALRPETLCSLRAPHDYRRGAEHLEVRDEADKARFGRRLPLTEEARAALDSVCPDAGYLFPRGRSGSPPDYRVTLRAAARRVGLDEERAGRISDYDFRHGRATHIVAETSNLAGASYLIGHKNITTTNHYVHVRQAHGERALAELKNGRGRGAT